jgi:hypothetical protein
MEALEPLIRKQAKVDGLALIVAGTRLSRENLARFEESLDLLNRCRRRLVVSQFRLERSGRLLKLDDNARRLCS